MPLAFIYKLIKTKICGEYKKYGFESVMGRLKKHYWYKILNIK
jgi:hypothetical protein